MHHLNSNHYTDPDSSRYHPRYHPDPPLSHVVASASSVLDQPPPPSLRDILGAYKANGDGDRDMLLAMLNAKTAEDQRLASLAALHRTMLEVYQSPPLLPLNGGGHHHYPTAKFTHSPPLREARPGARVYHHHHVSSLSRSPPHTRVPLPYMRPASPQPQPQQQEQQPRRKRVRASRSPPPPPPLPRRRDSVPVHETPSSELPPSPYSSSGSESAAPSPRSRGSMTIGSLLSTGAASNREGSGEPPLPDRGQGS